MVCYHDTHVTSRTRSGWMRAAPRDILKWFHELPLPSRVEFFCDLLQLCTPIELRFYGSCLEELARLHYDELRELENESNSVIDPKGEDCLVTLLKSPSSLDLTGRTMLFDASKFDVKRLGVTPLPSSFHILTTDSLLRSKLILRLALLRSANTVSAHAYFEALMIDNVMSSMTTIPPHNRDQTRLGGSVSYPIFMSKWPAGVSSDDSEDESVHSSSLSVNELKAMEEVLLIYTLAAFHPAFSFDQRQRLYAYLAALRLWSDAFRGVHAKHTRPGQAQACLNGANTPERGSRHLAHESHKNCSFGLRRSALTTACSSSGMCRSMRCVRRSGTSTCHQHFRSLSLEDLALLEVSFHTQLDLHSTRTKDNLASSCFGSRVPNPTDSQSLTPATPSCHNRGRPGTMLQGNDNPATGIPPPAARCCSCEASQKANLRDDCDFKHNTHDYSSPYTEACEGSAQQPVFSLDSSDDGTVSHTSTEPHSPIHHPHADAGSSSDELNAVSSRTLTASDRISMIRDSVLSNNDLSVSNRCSRNTDRCEPLGDSLSRMTGPSTSRFNSSEGDLGLPHFGLGKHTKDVSEYCRLAPKRHSSGSSPISTPPSEDSGSETVALTTSPASSYWDHKDPNLITAIPTIYSSTTATRATCPMCHQYITTCVPSTQVQTTPATTLCISTTTDVLNHIGATQDYLVSVSTPTKQQQWQPHQPSNGASFRNEARRSHGCTYCQQTESHSHCILSTTPSSKHRNCCCNHTGINQRSQHNHHRQEQRNSSFHPFLDPGSIDVLPEADEKPSDLDNGVALSKSNTFLEKASPAQTISSVIRHTDLPPLQQQANRSADNAGCIQTKSSNEEQCQAVLNDSPLKAANDNSCNSTVLAPSHPVNVVYSSRSTVSSSVVLRYPSPFWVPTSPAVHFPAPSFYTQSYMLSDSSLWIANSPLSGAPWAMHPSCTTMTTQPIQYVSVSDTIDSESKENSVPVDSVLSNMGPSEECISPLESDSMEHGSSTITNPSTLGNLSGPMSGASPSPLLLPPSAAPPVPLISSPQLFIFYPPTPDFFRSVILPMDLSNGQYVPPNTGNTTVQAATAAVDSGRGDNTDSLTMAGVPTPGQIDDNPTSAAATGVGLIPPLSSLTPVPLPVDRPRGPSSNAPRAPLGQPGLLGPTKTRSVATADPPTATGTDLIQSIASLLSADVHANLAWSNPATSIQQSQTAQQQRLSFRREVTSYLPSGLTVRPGPTYPNRGFHTLPPTAVPPPIVSPIYNGPFPTRGFLHPPLGMGGNCNSVGVFYHQSQTPGSFPSTGMTHVSSVHSCASTNTSSSSAPLLPPLSGFLLGHTSSDLPSGFPHPPPVVGMSRVSPSPCTVMSNGSVDSSTTVTTSPTIVTVSGSSSSVTSTSSSSMLVAERSSINSGAHSTSVGITSTSSLPVICSSNNTVTITATTTATSNSMSSVAGTNTSVTIPTSTTASTPITAPPFLSVPYMHPSILPPPPPPHPNIFFSQPTQMMPPHVQNPNFPLPLWPTLTVPTATAAMPSVHVHPRQTSCYNCGLPGHKAKYCPSRLPNQHVMENTFNLSYAPSK